MHLLRIRTPWLAFAALLAACADNTPEFHAGDPPNRLSDWNLFELSDSVLRPVTATLPFEPANTLFTDYALKLRTLWVPEGARIKLVDDAFEYPVGTVLSKTFYYAENQDGLLQGSDTIASGDRIDLNNARLMETRLLVRQPDGWLGLPYVWNQDETEAFLRIAGTSMPVNLGNGSGQTGFTYFVPNQNQCAGCHVREHPDGELLPLGAVARQLAAASSFQPGISQTDLLVQRGWLEQAPAQLTPAAWSDPGAELDARARAYLDINCGHCHNPEGAADTSALMLDAYSNASLVNMGVCKPPVAAGGGAGDLQFGIFPGRPEASILLYRMTSTEPDEMMPELGRALVHQEGVELVSNWIGAMEGSCP